MKEAAPASGRAAVRGAVYVAISSYASMGISLGKWLVLARWLGVGPADFGAYAFAATLVAFVRSFTTLAVDPALVAERDAGPGAYAAHRAIRLAMGLLNLLVLAGVALALDRVVAGWEALAAHLPALFGEAPSPAVETVPGLILLLGVADLVEAAGSTGRVALDKALRFGVVSAANVAGSVAGFVVAVVVAAAGGGAWALGLSAAASTMTAAGWWCLYIPRGLPLRPPADPVRRFLRYGLTLLPPSLATQVLFKYDDLLVGSFVSMRVLGFYDWAYELAKLPTGLISAVVTRVSMPLFARLQAERDRMARAYIIAVRALVRASSLLCVLVVAAPAEVIELLVGPTWVPVVPLLTLLVGYALLRPVFDVNGGYFLATGRPGVVSRVMTVQALVFIPIATAGVWYGGAAGVALAVDLVMAGGVVALYRRMKREFPLPLVSMFVPPAIAAAVALGLAAGLSPAGLDLIPRLLLRVGIAGAAFLAVLGAIEGRRIADEVRELVASGRAAG